MLHTYKKSTLNGRNLHIWTYLGRLKLSSGCENLHTDDKNGG